MASTKFYITSGLPPNDTADDGSSKIYVTSGFVPDDTESGETLLPIFVNTNLNGNKQVLSGGFQ